MRFEKRFNLRLQLGIVAAQTGGGLVLLIEGPIANGKENVLHALVLLG